MTERLLVCTDLDRTLIPNKPQSESTDARQHFAALVMRPEVVLAYVSGRDRSLVQQAMIDYQLPSPNFVIGDVGTTIYELGPRQEWARQKTWETEIAKDWMGCRHADIESLLIDIPALRLQESTKQNAFKLSYFVPMQSDCDKLAQKIEDRLHEKSVEARLIWSVDEPAGVGLLDILPARASKYHTIEALMKMHGFDHSNTVFCGDSGHLERLYIAQGDFMGLNGNYSGGMPEGITHYHPDTLGRMAVTQAGTQ